MPEHKKLEVTQTGSEIRETQRKRDTLRALGLGKIGRTVVHDATPSNIGMIRAVSHLVLVKELES